MNRTSKITRIYSLGNYKNIQIEDSINDIPEDKALDIHYVENLKQLQLLSIEETYRKYLDLYERTLLNVDTETALSKLDDKLEETLEQLGL